MHSITHKGPEEWWGKNATIEDWFDEMVGQANIINRYRQLNSKNVPLSRIIRLGNILNLFLYIYLVVFIL